MNKPAQALTKIAIIFTSLLLITNCKKQSSAMPAHAPVITLTPLAYDTVYAREGVVCIASVPNATSYLWNFGDSTTATTDSITHYYNKAGNYTITITATNASGTSSKTQNIVVLNAGFYTFKGDTTTFQTCFFQGDAPNTFDSNIPNNVQLSNTILLLECLFSKYSIPQDGTYALDGTYSFNGSDFNAIDIIQGGAINYNTGLRNNQFVTLSSVGNSVHGAKIFSGKVTVSNTQLASDSTQVTFSMAYGY